jgi:alpha-tubulin suppressor-like RCC1 family protein
MPEATPGVVSAPRAYDLGRVIAVALGREHGCAIAEREGERGLYCWGNNGEGQRGDASTAASTVPVRARTGDISLLSAGGAHTCIVRNGSLECFGSAVVVDAVPSLSAVVELASGANHACARLESGAVHCWGEDHAARDTIWTDAREIFAGGKFSCALRASSSGLSCQGEATLGGLPFQFPTARVLPGFDYEISDVGMGESHLCVVRADDASVRCAGVDTNGEASARLDVGEPALDVEGGNGVTCVATERGALVCFGRDDVGQRGDGSCSVSP